MKIAIEKHDSQAADVEEMKDSTKMFRAARLMRRKLQPKLIVHDDKGQTITNPKVVQIKYPMASGSRGYLLLSTLKEFLHALLARYIYKNI